MDEKTVDTTANENFTPDDLTPEKIERMKAEAAQRIEATKAIVNNMAASLNIDPGKIMKESGKCVKDYRFNQKSKGAKNVAVTVMAITATAAIGYFSYKTIKHSKEDERQDAALSIC